MNFKAFHMSERGESHIRDGRECQDHSSSFSDEWGTVAVVSDGHGGCDYVRSQLGAAFACEAAIKNIRMVLETISSTRFLAEPEQVLSGLEAAIINSWNEAVRCHYEAHPFTEEELCSVSKETREAYMNGEWTERAYGATLIATAVTKDFWFGIQIGDGRCVVIDSEGHCTQPIPWDEKCFLNKTTSICSAEALDDFRHFYSKDIPAAVFAATDGIDNSFKNDDDMYGLYRTVLYAFSISNYDEAVAELQAYLPDMSKNGSMDDVSIAGSMDMDMLQSVADKMNNKKAKKEKKAVSESHIYPRFCCMCGAKLVPGKLYCQCGSRILLNAIRPAADLAYSEKDRFFYRLERYLFLHI